MSLVIAFTAGLTSSERSNETDPLVCPKCSGEMHIIGFIDQRAVIKKIL